MGAPSSTSFIIPSTLFSLQTALAVCTSHCILKWHACHCLPRSHVWHFHSKVFTVEYELKIHRITAEKRKWKILPLEKERQNTLHCRTAQKQSRRYGCSSSTQSRMLSAFTHSGEMSEFSERHQYPGRDKSFQCRLLLFAVSWALATWQYHHL